MLMSDALSLSPIGKLTDARSAPILPLSVRSLGLRFGQSVVLNDINLDLGPAGCTVLMGANGAGKSLLLRVLHGLVLPTDGQFDWNGTSGETAVLRQALVFQKPVLLRRSVLSNIDFVLKARGKDRSQGMHLLEHVGLADKARQPARRLSGGEQQRLALARALATEPDVLMLDEPTASLDPSSALAIETIIAEACRNGVRILLVTHDIGLAQRLADDVVFLHQGSVAAHCAADSFFPDPPNAAARDYLNGKIVL